GLRHRLEGLGLVDRDRMVLRRIAHGLDQVVALAMIGGQAPSRQLAQEVRLHQRPAETGQGLKIVCRLRKRYARKVDAKELCIFFSVGRGVEHRIDKAKQLFGSKMTGVPFINEFAKRWCKVLNSLGILKVISPRRANFKLRIVKMEGKYVSDIVS